MKSGRLSKQPAENEKESQILVFLHLDALALASFQLLCSQELLPPDIFFLKKYFRE